MRFYTVELRGGRWLVVEYTQGNASPICETVHGQPQAMLIADALNAWVRRYVSTHDPGC